MQAFCNSSNPFPLVMVKTKYRTDYGKIKLKRSNFKAAVKYSKTLDKTRMFPSEARRAAIKRIQLSTDLESDLSSADGLLQVQDLNSLLGFFGESSKWREMSQVFDWMLKNNEVNFASYSRYIKFMGIGRNPIKALKIYNSIPDKSIKVHVSVCNSIIGCLVKNGKCESSIKLYDQMKSDGLAPDLVTYSSVCVKIVTHIPYF